MNYETRTLAADDGQVLLDGPPRRRSRIWLIVAVVAAVVVALVAFLTMGGKKAPPQSGPAKQLPLVSVVVPGRSTVARAVTATGSLAARREMPVGVAGEGGMITRVLVEPGQWVARGQVLATVDRSVQTQTAASLSAQINVARSDAAIAQSELDRAKALVDRGFISKADLERRTATRDAALARVKVAQATLGEAQARTGRLDIRAPAAGLVLTRTVEPGQIVGAGSGTLFRLAEGGQMELRAQVSESELAGLRVGSRAQVTPVGGSASFNGEVWQVSPVIDPQTRQGIVRIALRYDTALRPGGFASAAIISGTSNVPELPNSAIQSDDKGNFVYVVGPDDKVARRGVTVGEVSDNGMAIAAGLAGNERVVQSAGAFLNAGQTVKPALVRAGTGTTR